MLERILDPRLKDHPPHYATPGSAGLRLPYTEVHAVPWRDGQAQLTERCASGATGVIVLRGPHVSPGYTDAARNAGMFESGWLVSGDLGHVDEDGYFFLTDRLKRMINASGFKVWPAEVEALMFRHPAIQEACIISTKDAYRGESVKAVVVLRQSHRGQVSEQDIIDWCRDNMAVYKAPRLVQFVDSLPKSGSGKVMWRMLQEAEHG